MVAVVVACPSASFFLSYSKPGSSRHLKFVPATGFIDGDVSDLCGSFDSSSVARSVSFSACVGVPILCKFVGNGLSLSESISLCPSKPQKLPIETLSLSGDLQPECWE